MAYVAQMLTQEPIYKPSSIFCFKPILLSAHKLTLLIYGDNNLFIGWFEFMLVQAPLAATSFIFMGWGSFGSVIEPLAA